MSDSEKSENALRDFAAAVRDPALPVPETVTSYMGERPPRRFAVYRNNVHASLTTALAAHFPAVERLIGRARFQAAALAYIRAEPPVSPVLLRYGATFPEFLRAYPPLAGFAYLPDVARLEWLWLTAYHAADAAPLPHDDLAAIPLDVLAAVRFRLHPSLGLVRSRFPVVTIWEANAGDGPVPGIDLAMGGEDGLVVRPGMDVEVRRLPPGGHALVDSLQAGRTLGEAFGVTVQDAGEVDVTAVLQCLFESGAIVAAEHPRSGAGA